jgi:hypothetical protein
MLIAFVMLVSIGFPPLLIVTAPLLLIYLVRLARRVGFVRRSRDYYYEELSLLGDAKTWRDR